MHATVSTARPDTSAITTVTDRDEVAARKGVKSININDSRKEEMDEMRDSGFKLTQYLKQGFTIDEIKGYCDWFTLKDMVDAGCGYDDLYKAGYTLADLVALGWKAIDDSIWKDVYLSGTYSLQQLKDFGCKGNGSHYQHYYYYYYYYYHYCH